MNERMSKRLWLLGVGVLVSIGVLMACGSKYNSSSNGLLLVGSQGSGLIQTFSFSLNNGHISAIANPTSDTANKNCVLNGVPSSIVIERTGSFAYALIESNPQCGGSSTGIATLKINSDGTTSEVGSRTTPTAGTIHILGQLPPNDTELVAVVPAMLAVDAAGKFLFVADRATTDAANRFVPGGVSVFSIGNDGVLKEVAGSPFFTTAPATTMPQASVDIVSVAATPTVFPGIGINGTQNAVCSTPGNNPPSAEFVYAVDALSPYQIFEFQVDTSSGVLAPPTGQTAIPAFATAAVPAGIAVDPCDRFVYVSNGVFSSKVSAYLICATVHTPCTQSDGSLVAVSGSPFSLAGNASNPGPLAVDPYGNNVYVVGLDSNTVSGFKLSPTTGALTAMSPAVVATGLEPRSITIRGDDNWMFIANHNGATVSQYSIVPATGALTAEAPIHTDNYPWGVAVK
jgi:6-phosphogluconolactonase (cycloisomerase 2 family)